MDLKLYRTVLIFIFLFILVVPDQVVAAQSEPENPVYIVQNGDTLSIIAQKFGVTPQDLMNANHISDPNSIMTGSEMTIPGLTGVSGILETMTIPLGETLQTLNIRYQLPQSTITQINRITSPSEIYAGSSLILPHQKEKITLKPFASVGAGQSLFELAIIKGQNPWDLALTNQWERTFEPLPGEMVFAPPSAGVVEEISSISPVIVSLDVKPLPLTQGATEVIRIVTNQPAQISGELAGYKLNFFQESENSYVALQGVHAMASPGLSILRLAGTFGNNQNFNFEQMVVSQPGNFGQETLIVDPITIDPSVTKPEEDQILEIVKNATPDKQWKEAFRYPVDEPICIKSWYGTRRTYNDGMLTSFHTGLDFGVCAPNLNAYAPAPGKVVFTGELIVRGKAVLIDHGWGVYSGFYHFADINVNTGDHVDTGQVVGQIGATGRVTGAHLHYETWVNGVQVQPFDWFENVYP